MAQFEGSGTNITFPLDGRQGLYSNVNRIVAASYWAMRTGRNILLDHRKFLGISWAELFGYHWPTGDADESTWRSRDFQAFIRRSRIVSRLAGRYDPAYRCCRWIAQALARPTRESEKRPSTPYVAVHIRQGDKIHGYMSDGKLVVEGLPVRSEHFAAVVRARYSHLGTCYVMSDDIRSALAFKDMLTDFDVIIPVAPARNGYEQSRVNSMDAEERLAEYRQAISEVEIAASATAFVGTFRSNLSRFVALVHDHPENCLSLDDRKRWYIG